MISYRLDYRKFTSLGTKFIFGLRYGGEAICDKSISSPSLPYPSEKWNKSQINVPLMSILGFTISYTEILILVPRFVSSRFSSKLGTLRR
jgi:hypothetical protein